MFPPFDVIALIRVACCDYLVDFFSWKRYGERIPYAAPLARIRDCDFAYIDLTVTLSLVLRRRGSSGDGSAVCN